MNEALRIKLLHDGWGGLVVFSSPLGVPCNGMNLGFIS